MHLSGIQFQRVLVHFQLFFFSYTFVSGGKPIGGLGTKPQLYEALLLNCEFFFCTHLNETFVSMCIHASGQCVVTLRGHADSVNAVRFLPFSNTLCTCSADKTISLWDARTVRLCVCTCLCVLYVFVCVFMCVCMCVCGCECVAGCCLATKILNLNNTKWNR